MNFTGAALARCLLILLATSHLYLFLLQLSAVTVAEAAAGPAQQLDTDTVSSAGSLNFASDESINHKQLLETNGSTDNTLTSFEQYKKKFHKRYKSLVEQAMRYKFYLARLARVFLSKIRFRSSVAQFRTNYRLGINQMSDYSPDEIGRMKNKHAGEVFQHEQPVEPEDDEEMLECYKRGSNTTAGVPPASNSEPLQRSQRVKRDTDQATPTAPWGPGRDECGPPLVPGPGQTIKRLRTFAPPPGQKQRHRRVTRWQLVVSEDQEDAMSNSNKEGHRDEANAYDSLEKKESLFSNSTQINDHLSSPWSKVEAGEEGSGGDRIYFDLRRTTKCFLLPREQGICGSCYAFAAISMLEWLHCMKSGQLVAFSEQYIVDCATRTGCQGCDGGRRDGVVDFVANYGIELRALYHYKMNDDQCPYEPDVELHKTGHIRVELTDAIEIPQELWHIYLKYGPMYVALATTDSFTEYESGVHDDPNCGPVGDHAMVLVGHGREEGIDYWLLRNSYSPAWGEEGYYKLAKTSKCIQPAQGMMIGSDDGQKYNSKLEHNIEKDAAKIKSRYAQFTQMDFLT